MNKQPDITDATREAFVTAFFVIAQKKGINKITIREITTLAGYNRTTFYRYFVDVYGLLEYAEDELLCNVRDALGDQPTRETIGERRFFEILIRCFHEHSERVTVFLSEENRSHFLRRVKEHLLCPTGGDTPKIKVIKDMYFSGIFHVISIHLQDPSTLSDEDLLDIVQGLFDRWYRPEIQSSIPAEATE